MPNRACLASAASVLVLAGEALGACPVPDEALREIRFTAEAEETETVRLSDMGWFEGTWAGEVFGLQVEHVVLSATAGQMPGLVRLHDGDSVAFYELSSFLTEGGQLVYRNRLFTSDLWVQPNGPGQYMTRPAIAAEGSIVFFDGITFAANGPDCAVVSFALPDANGVLQTQVVEYARVPPAD